MKIKYILLKVDERTKKRLWNQKEELAIYLGRDMTWEEFFVEAKNKKIE
jgi:hypothetical protein